MAARSLLKCVRPMTGVTSARNLNFNLTEDSLALQELARKFAREEMMPKAAYHDQTMEYPQEIFEKAWELGLGWYFGTLLRVLICDFSQLPCWRRHWWSWSRMFGQLHHR